MTMERIQDFHWGGGGGEQKSMCANAHLERKGPKSFTAGVQGPFKGPWSSRGFWCYLVLFEPYF